MAISTSRLVISVFLVALVSHAAPLFAQPSGQTSVPATVSTANLRPGTWCLVTLETPPQSDASSLVGYAGTIQEITKDEIVLVTTCDFRTERRVPFLAALPYIGQFFTSISTGRDVVARRIPLEKIAAIECKGGTKEDGDAESLERIGVDLK